MTTKLHPDYLIQTLFEDTDKTKPCIIYMGVGTHCNDQDTWNYNTNQQLPAFLHDWKINNPTIPVKIILFDQATITDPYIITDTSLFFTDSFVKDTRYCNVYKSEFGIQVYSFALNVNWFNDNFNLKENYDITELIISIIKSVSESNHLFFFHEFTGRNPEFLEYEIKKLIDFNEHKVCIDISRGKDLSCCVDFSEPENYPLIKLNQESISWINAKFISLEKQEELIKKFTNKTIAILECPYYNSDMFDYYLFKHIVHNNRYIFNICKQIIHVIRTLYNKDSEFSTWQATSIMKLNILTIKIPNVKIYLNKLFSTVQQIEDVSKIGVDRDTLFPYKLDLLEDLKTIIEISLSNIKYLKEDELSVLFIMLDTLDDKYKLMSIFNDFCSAHNITY